MFKKYEAMMAQKRQRNTGKQVKQRQRKTFATEITNSKVICTSQRQLSKTLKRVDVLEDDLYIEASIHVIFKASVSGFNVPSTTCDILRGSSIESLDEIKTLNSTLYM